MSALQQRSMDLLKTRGYLVASVERRKRFPAPKSKPCKVCGLSQMIDIASDLWNVFDLIAIRSSKQFIADQWGHGGADVPVLDTTFVQVTDHTSHSKRRNKIIASPEAKLCLLAGARILIQSWRKVQNRWMPHDEWITLDQFVFGLPDTVEQHYEDLRRQKMVAREPGYTLPLSPEISEETPF